MICDTIKSLRENANLSQAALAKILGVTRSSVNAWEIGLSIPTAQYIVELSRIFSVSSDYILGIVKKEAIYVDDLTTEEKQLLYSLVEYFRKPK